MAVKEKQALAYRRPTHLVLQGGEPLRGEATYHSWYVRHHETLAYCHLVADPAADHMQLLEVEVRPTHRGLGLVRQVFEELQGHFGKPLLHEGQYTEAGLLQVAPFFNSAAQLEAYPEWAATPQASYVRDWDHRLPRKP